MAKHFLRKRLMVVAGRKFRSFEYNGVRVDANGGMHIRSNTIGSLD